MIENIRQKINQIKIRRTKCCIVFPCEYIDLFERVVLNHITQKFNINCQLHPYNKLTKKVVQTVKKQLQSSCILILVYKGEIQLEQAYKLGIAHAYESCVILVNLEASRDNYSSLPEYIKHNCLIYEEKFSKPQDIDNFLKKMSQFILAVLNADVYEILYQEAVSICGYIERRESCSLAKVDKEEFIERLSSKDVSLYFNNYDMSYKILLERIIRDKDSLGYLYYNQAQVLASQNVTTSAASNKLAENKVNSNSSVYVTVNNTNQQANTMTTENKQTWNGDRIEGDKVMGDKDTVAGNKMRATDVAGDAIAGNKIVNSQNLAEAAKDIKALLDQITATDTTKNSTLIAMKAIESIENNPTLKDRIINAGKEAGFAALDAAVDHPAVKIVTAAIKGAMDA
jgi:hypothetical protein